MSRAAECGTPLSRSSGLDVGFEAALSGPRDTYCPTKQSKGCPGIGRRKAILLPLWSQQPAAHMCFSFRSTGKVRFSVSSFAWLFQPTSSSHSTHSYSIGENPAASGQEDTCSHCSLLCWITHNWKGEVQVLLHFSPVCQRQLCSCVNGNRGGKARAQ